MALNPVFWARYPDPAVSGQKYRILRLRFFNVDIHFIKMISEEFLFACPLRKTKLLTFTWPRHVIRVKVFPNSRNVVGPSGQSQSQNNQSLKKKINVWKFSLQKFEFCYEGKLVYILYKTHTLWKQVLRYHPPFN